MALAVLPTSPLRAYPRVIPVGRPVEIRVRSISPDVQFDAAATYRVTHYPCDRLDSGSWPWLGASLPAEVRGDELAFTVTSQGEEQHVFAVERIGSADDGAGTVGKVTLFAVADDLYNLTPYRGDFHMHSNRSDGREEPAYVLASCRKIGMDFAALTDHRRYAPSLEAQAAFANTGADLAIYPGEEVHPPNNPIHIVNFGGSRSVNDLFADQETYMREVSTRQAQLPSLPAGLNPYMVASAEWCFDQIREAGGLGIFCHPYWFANSIYCIPEALTDMLFERRPFDAYEVIGGYPFVEMLANTLQSARYYAEAAKGKRVPIVGVSDSHGVHRDLFGWYATLVFSPSVALPDLIASIKAFRSVGVETIPGEQPRVHGPFRLVKFALFLLTEVIPEHDALCAEEGELMLRHIAGEESARAGLAACQGKVAALMRKIMRGEPAH
jgi:hypothetical protein